MPCAWSGFGRPDVPVARGAEKPLLRPFTGKGWEVHGRNGLGEADLPEPQGTPDSRRAAQFIIDTIMENPGEITLVPLGPLTNVALAVAAGPRIADNVREVVLMGGAANVAGNASPVPRPTFATIRSRRTSSSMPAGP